MRQQHLLAQNSIETVNIDVPVSTLKLNCLKPINGTIDAVADTGSSLNAISNKIASEYKQHIKTDRRKTIVRTGSGYVTCDKYLPVYIRNRSAIIKIKFYILPKLPYDYLVGRSVIR